MSADSRAALAAIDLHFHDLRHEAGSRWADARMPLSHIQRLLGHADLEMTTNYLNADFHHLEDSIRAFEAAQSLHVVAHGPEIAPPTGVQQTEGQQPKPTVN